MYDWNTCVCLHVGARLCVCVCVCVCVCARVVIACLCVCFAALYIDGARVVRGREYVRSVKCAAGCCDQRWAARSCAEDGWTRPGRTDGPPGAAVSPGVEV